MNGEDKMLLEVAQSVANEGFDWVLSQGFEWYREWIVPCTKKINAISSNEKMKTDFWTEIGDLYDMLDVPRHSLKAYEHAIKLDPSYKYPQQEYLDLLYQIGEFEKGFQFNKDYLAESSDEALKVHQQKKKEGRSYMEDSRTWHAREYLLDGRYDDVIALLEEEKNSDSLLLMAATYSALGEEDKALDYWRKLLDKKTKIELSNIDWFYLSSKLYTNPEFWTIIRDLSPKLKGTFEQFTSLINTKGKVMQGAKMRDTIANFHIARLNRDVPTLLSMYNAYPDWKELREVIGELQAPGEG